MTAFIDLYIDQGASWNHIINLTDDVNNTYINIQGFTVSSYMKRSYYSSNVSAVIECTITNPSEGEITLSLPYQTTANLKPGRYVFDVRSISQANVASRLLEGYITVTPGVTK